MIKALLIIVQLVILANFVVAGLTALGLSTLRKTVKIAQVEGILLTCICFQSLCEIIALSMLGPARKTLFGFKVWWLVGAGVLSIGLWVKALYTLGIRR